MPRESRFCPRLYRYHLLDGDTPEFLSARLARMAEMPERNARVRELATMLYGKVSDLTLDDLKARGSSHSSPRMHVRHIHDQIVYKARKEHCHAALYRSSGAHALLSAGGVMCRGDAVVHCEHTVPTGVVLEQLHLLHRAGRLSSPPALLEWLLSFAIASCLLQVEAKGTDPSINLNRRRSLGGIISAWKDDHPDFPSGKIASGEARPFMRYAGTGLEIIYVPTGATIALEEDTIGDHRRRIAHLRAYQVGTYFDADEQAKSPSSAYLS